VKHACFSAMACVLLYACAKGRDETSQRVYFHCRDFTRQANEMSIGYQTRLSAGTLSDEQRAAADLKYRIVGREAQMERGLAMHGEFLFCDVVRNDPQDRPVE
jgi:hypothetical protein